MDKCIDSKPVELSRYVAKEKTPEEQELYNQEMLEAKTAAKKAMQEYGLTEYVPSEEDLSIAISNVETVADCDENNPYGLKNYDEVKTVPEPKKNTQNMLSTLKKFFSMF